MATSVEALARLHKQKLGEFETALGYRFTDLRCLQLALMHSSFAFESVCGKENNEKLEFLGDAVLDLVLSAILLHRYPEMREGELSKLRASLVNEQHLAMMAREIQLDEQLFLGKGEESSGGREKSSILSSAYEAVLGAVFEDGGYEAISEVIQRLFRPYLDAKKDEIEIADSKSRLQELLQAKHNQTPTYVLDSEEGPSHRKQFVVSVHFRDQLLGQGQGSSKKEAEQRAAAAALESL
ncbi:MAG: ribonuclease III [Deltaproteobacteria bacterium]|nr:MAG: ribonuclease III [Desulfobacterales bacterium]PIE73769.1 MAG: ribonuclease III [Deltaproteobacteria bacterium]